MDDKTILKIVAIVSLAILESVAMATGHDGALFLPVAAIIGGIAGYELRDIGMKIPAPKEEEEEGP